MAPPPLDPDVWSSLPVVTEEVPAIETLTEMTMLWTTFFILAGLWSTLVPALWLWKKHEAHRWIFRPKTPIATKSNWGKNVIKVLKLMGLVTNKGDMISQPGKDTLILALVLGVGQLVTAKNPDYIPFVGSFLLFCGALKICTALFLLGIWQHSGKRLLTSAGLATGVLELLMGLAFIYFARVVYVNPFDIPKNVTNSSA